MKNLEILRTLEELAHHFPQGGGFAL